MSDKRNALSVCKKYTEKTVTSTCNLTEYDIVDQYDFST